MLTFDLFTTRSNLLFHAFIWGKKCWEFIFWTSSIIQLNLNLMMSIRAPSRHKTAKWAGRKSKMATTAAIFKINFWHLFPNFWSLWAETSSVATRSKQAKFCCSEFKDGCNSSTPLNKMAARATNRKSSNDTSSLTNCPISKYLHRSVPPMTLYQIAKMVPLGWTKWRPELKIEKPLKAISSMASGLISK